MPLGSMFFWVNFYLSKNAVLFFFQSCWQFPLLIEAIFMLWCLGTGWQYFDTQTLVHIKKPKKWQMQKCNLFNNYEKQLRPNNCSVSNIQTCYSVCIWIKHIWSILPTIYSTLLNVCTIYIIISYPVFNTVRCMHYVKRS